MSLLKILGIDKYTSRLKTWVNSQIDKKHAEFVGAAPEQLDTLNELAAALGDDPNFAATITAELAKKANKDDVTAELAKKASTAQLSSLNNSKQDKLSFCGNPLISTDLAKTVFPPIQKTGPVALSPYERLVFVMTNGITLTLPAMSSVQPGTKFCFLSSVNGFRLKSDDGAIINYLSSNLASSSEVDIPYSLYQKRMFTCISSGADWVIF